MPLHPADFSADYSGNRPCGGPGTAHRCQCTRLCSHLLVLPCGRYPLPFFPSPPCGGSGRCSDFPPLDSPSTRLSACFGLARGSCLVQLFRFYHKLHNLANPGNTGQFFLEISLVLLLIGDDFRIVHMLHAFGQLLVRLLVYRFIRRELVYVILARQER